MANVPSLRLATAKGLPPISSEKTRVLNLSAPAVDTHTVPIGGTFHSQYPTIATSPVLSLADAKVGVALPPSSSNASLFIDFPPPFMKLCKMVSSPQPASVSVPPKTTKEPVDAEGPGPPHPLVSSTPVVTEISFISLADSMPDALPAKMARVMTRADTNFPFHRVVIMVYLNEFVLCRSIAVLRYCV